MNDCLVTIVVPVYNGEKLLKRCVDSLIGQTLKGIQIILVDDGSIDGSGAICDGYAAQHSQVTVIHQENGGSSSARNRGIELAEGSYIGFVDGDDWCEPQMFELLLSGMYRAEVDVCVCGYFIEYPQENITLSKVALEGLEPIKVLDARSAIFQLETKGMLNSACNKLYRRDILQKNAITFPPVVMGEDLLFNTSYFVQCKTVALVCEPLYHYMREETISITASYVPNLYEQVAPAYPARAMLYEHFGMQSEPEQQCFNEAEVSYMFSCIPNLFRRKCQLTRQEKVKFMRTLLANQDLQVCISHFEASGVHLKIFKQIYGLNSAHVMYLFYSTLFFFRNNFGKMYKIYRRKVIHKA